MVWGRWCVTVSVLKKGEEGFFWECGGGGDLGEMDEIVGWGVGFEYGGGNGGEGKGIGVRIFFC